MEVIEIFDAALKVVWKVAIAIAACGLILVLVEKRVPSRTKLETRYRLDKKLRNTTENELEERERGEKKQTNKVNSTAGSKK